MGRSYRINDIGGYGIWATGGPRVYGTRLGQVTSLLVNKKKTKEINLDP